MILESAILRLISEKPVKRATLLRVLRQGGHDLTDRELRKAVENMITKGGYVISSSEKGYQAIHSKEELDKAVQYLNKKASAIAIRKNSLITNFNAQRQSIQIPMFI